MGILFGPVLSRRLGISLGIDIVPPGICSYDCLYCEAGTTKNKTTEPIGEVTPEDVIDSLTYYFEHNQGKIDYLTFSGTGEPTLNPYIGEIIKKIKKKFKIPICLLTNSSLLSDQLLVKAISPCDIIMPSLDAVSKDVFIKLNRPAMGIYIEYILLGLKKLVKIAKGKVIIEILIVDGYNNTTSELTKLSEAINEINPHGVYLNTIDRPPAESNISGISSEELHTIGKQYFSRYIDNDSKEVKINLNNIPNIRSNDIKFKKMLQIRGATIDDLVKIFKTTPGDIERMIRNLKKDTRFYTTEYKGRLRLHYDPKK